MFILMLITTICLCHKYMSLKTSFFYRFTTDLYIYIFFSEINISAPEFTPNKKWKRGELSKCLIATILLYLMFDC